MTVPTVTSLIALGVYVRTIAPSLPFGDSGDLITAAAVLGIAHPPGYPIITVLGHLFSLLPLGSPALGVNLLSAVLHAAAAGVTALCVYRLLDVGKENESSFARPLTRRWAAIAALVGGLALAFSPAFWRYALVAEVFSLNSLFAALLLLLLLEWQGRPRRIGLLWAFAFGCGLAFSNQQTIVFLAPAFVVLLWSGVRRRWLSKRSRSDTSYRLSGRQLAVAAGFVALGLVPYAYLPLAARLDPPYNWGDPDTLENFWRHITRADYGTFNLAPQGRGGSPLEQLSLLAANLSGGFTPVGLVMLLAGAWLLARSRRVRGLALLLAFVFTGPAFVVYANPVIDTQLWKGVLERFYILPSVPFAVVVGLGAYQIMQWMSQAAAWSGRTTKGGSSLAGMLTRSRWAGVLRQLSVPVAALLLAYPFVQAAIHFASVDQSGNYLAHQFGEDILAQLEPGALLVTRGDEVTMPVAYLQLVEGYRPDVVNLDVEMLKLRPYVSDQRRRHPDVVIPFDAYDEERTNSIKALIEANFGRHPVYILGNTKEKDLLERFDTMSAGFATKLTPKGTITNRSAILLEHGSAFEHTSYPARSYADTTFEFGVAQMYGQLAFNVAYALHTDGRPAEAEPLYRTAIRLAPTELASFKNLGLLLLDGGSNDAEAGTLWRRYLELKPGDPDAELMRSRLAALNARAP